ncbi:non-ribosomal peptide synthase/polyketide synthase [Corallococcus exiguus]|uniref:non-ribosomal peptide synthase/polyketide synthase n=1 Tax=Corallococcus exiguus TaxID=83462 RepID=UPI001A8D8545|nr:non-ribosomal peptide synthase/polyketide synthase [Corallococcus exiguus]MBN8468384.1 non-ribosomal peptide synthase/polyketide synthase [Corallococcus exiguus]
MSDILKRLAELPPEKQNALLKKLKAGGARGATPRRSHPPLEPRAAGTRLPLSFAQQRLWFLEQLEPGTARYNVPAAVRLLGALDLAVLARAFEELLRRHEVLRTVFREQGDSAEQVVLTPSPLALPVVDLTALPPEQRHVEVTRRASAEAQRPFDLVRGPLLSTTLLRLAADEHVLVLNIHHIISDAWSTAVMVRELGQLYAAFGEGQPSPLPELPVQYGDCALWQRAWLEGAELERQLAYWRQQLAGAPGLLALPTDRPRPAEQTFHGAALPVRMSRELSEALKGLATREGVTPYMLLLAAFQLLLGRYAGQEDVCVGSSIAGRVVPEQEGLIGFFANTLVLRTRLSGDPTFRELLRQVKDTTLGAYAHQDIPFEKLVEELKPERNLGHAPLFQVLFAFLNAPATELRLPSLSMRLMELETHVSKFDLELAFTESDGRLQGNFVYNTDLFDAATLARMAGHLQVLLEGIVAAPEARLSGLPLLSPEERQQVLGAWNQATRDLPRPALVHRLFEAQVRRAPEAIALRSGDETLSYGELNARANQLARHLRRLGVGPEMFVALCLERSPELVVAMLATLKTGAAFLPLDPGAPSERLDFITSDANAPVLLTHSSLEHLLDRRGYVLRLDSDWARVERELEDDLDAEPDPDHLAYVIYTSGSTGRPKGTLLRHRGLCNTALQTIDFMDLRPDDRLLQFFSPAFDASISEIFPALLAGATLVLASREELMPGEPLLSVITGQEITIFKVTPSVLAQLEVPPLKNVRTLVVAGEACPPELVARFKPGRRFVNAYGPTETTVCAAVNTDVAAPRVTLGRPFHNVRAYVLDPHLRPVPLGVPGELFIGGMGLARGYLGRPELTAERFLPNPFAHDPGERLYRTGDRARWLANGELEYLGRLDFQVKLRGFRIELGEIEAALRKQPGVREAVVTLREDTPGHKRLVAYCVPEEEATEPSSLSAATLREALATHLPDYMLPAAFVVLDALPLNSSGKLERQALPPPDSARADPASSHVAPRDEVEQRLATIWAGVLGMGQVSVLDNFFELGGDSILSLQVVARARQVGLLLNTRDLFQHQTIARLAQVARSTTEAAGEQGLIIGPVPLTPIQRHLFQHDAPHAHHFNQALLLTPRQRLEPSRLEQVLRHLVLHHDALRLRFFRHEGAWLQECTSPEEAPFHLTQVDLSTTPADGQPAALEAEASRLQASFVLSEPPLFRAALFHLGGDAQRLLVVANHLVVDAVSWRVLLEDLESGWSQLQQGQPLRLPAKSTSFQAWTRNLEEYAHSEPLAAQAPLWLDAARLQLKSLPTDAAGTNTRDSERAVFLGLDAEETRHLLQEATTAWRARINDVLLTALARAMAEWTGQSHVLVHLEGHGREELFPGVDLSRTVGWFTALVPVLLPVPEHGSLGDGLRAIRDTLRRLPDHGIGAGLLKWLGPQELSRRLHAQPVPQVAFNYLGQLDGTATGSALFTRALERTGPSASPAGTRLHLLELNGSVLDGCLRFTLTYSDRIHHEATARTLGERFLHHLRALLAQRHSEDARRFSPGDFPLARLSQPALDALVRQAPSGVEDIYPLSPMQQGILFHALLAPTSAVYFQQLAWTVDALDLPAFLQAWRHCLKRHTILRSSFHWEGLDAPLQVVHADPDLPIDSLDWSQLSSDEQQARFESLLVEDKQRGVELRAAPLLRLTVIHLGPQGVRFLWSHHHLLVDGWSLGLLMREVFSLYETLRAGQTPREDPRPAFGEYIAWLQRRGTTGEDFWREYLRGFPVPTPLPADSHQPASGQSAAEAALSGPGSAALQAFAREHHVTVHTLALASWALLLSRHGGGQDVVFGNTVAGRPPELPGSESLVGLFINSLPVRVHLPSEASALSPWLQSLQNQQLEARQYEHSPLVQVQAVSEVPRGTPLFDSLLVFENYPLDATLLEHSSLRVRDIHGFELSNYPLTASVLPGSTLRLRLVFDTPRFAPEAMRHLLARWVRVLESFPAAKRLDDISLLTAGERQRLLVEWNDTASEYPRASTLPDVFERIVARVPDQIALEFGEARLTYRQLDERANRLAWHLRGLGVSTDDRVAIAVERSLELVVSLLAILKAGGAYVPLDPAYPSERLVAMVEDARPRVLITQKGLVSRLPAVGQRTVVLEDIDLAGLPVQAPPRAVWPENLAYIDFTSGSTGRPKGVGTPQSSVLRTVLGVDYAHLGPDETFLLIAPVSFDASTLELWGPLLHGARLVIFPPHAPSDVHELGEVLVRHGVTTLHLTAGLLTQVVDHNLQGLRGVRQLLTGGDVVSAPHVRRVMESLRIPVTACYGPTETTLFAACHRMTRPEQAGSVVPLGRPIGNTRVYVLDAGGQPVPEGVVGELFIGGDGVARGYVEQPALTAERFLPDPFSTQPGQRLYRTGDLARWRHDGVLEFLGRGDAQVKLRGYRIELAEVESALLTHSQVRQAVALVREDLPGDKRLVAYVVAGELDVSALREHLRPRLPEFMLPSAFVLLDALPLTPNAKVDRKALPAPEGTRAPTVEFIAPRSDIEQRLADIWQRVLRVDRIGIHDDFFALGGHSLLATQAVSRIRSEFRIELPLRALFDAPTIAALALALEPASSTRGLKAPALRALPRTGPLPLSFAQQRLWFLERLEPSNASYNVPSALRLEGRLDVPALRRAFDALVQRHESLRTVFGTGDDGQPFQEVRPPVPLGVPCVDLSALPAAARQEEVARLAAEEGSRPFNLGDGPLLRATLLRVSEDEHVLLLTMHHIVSDAWSGGVLVREMAALYEAFSHGRASPLSELPLQYPDYAVWQRGWLQGDAMEEQVSWWRRQLEAAPALLELPTDHPRPPVRTYRGAHHHFRLSTELSGRLRDFSQRQGTTPFMVLLAAFHALLHRYSGQDDISVGSPIAGRPQAELEGLIGFFVNTLVLRARLHDDPTFLDLLQQVRATTLDAFAHQDVPFEKLVEALRPQRDMSTTPLFQAMLVLQNVPMGPLQLPGLCLRPLEVETRVAKYDLLMMLVDGAEGFSGSLEYATDLFESSTAARLVTHFQCLLTHALEAPRSRLSALHLLTPGERHQLLVSWNDTGTDFPSELTVHELISRQAALAPEAIALEAGDTRQTFGWLEARANQLARHLRVLGVGPEVRVGLFLERSPDMVVALLAVLKAGGAYVPFDIAYPEERLAFMLADSGVTLLLTQRSLQSRLPPHSARVACLDDEAPPFQGLSSEPPPPAAAPHHLAYVLYTSGSTGRPKGVLIEHRGVVNYLSWCARTYPRAPRGAPVHSPLAFDLTVTSLLLPLSQGTGVQLVAEAEDVEGLSLAMRERDSFGLVKLTPSHLQMLSKLLPASEAATATRAFVIGGEALSFEQLAFWRAHAPATRLFNEYGPTETVVGCCVHEVEAHDASTSGPVPIGHPIANVELHVLDARGALVPVGVPGELYIGGLPLARGYWRRPELTAERFIPHPFARTPGERLYRTGDRVRRRADGTLEYLGRLDSQVKVRGFRIELGEIESVLGLHPGVHETRALVREDTPGDQRLVAYVLPQAGQAPDASELRDFLLRRLPEYMVPVAFIRLEAFPLNAHGKVDRAALPRPDGESRVHDSRHVAPRTPVEQQLAALWCELLGVPRVGVHDNFFVLGGHSLLALQLSARMLADFQVELPLRTLFDSPTLETLAQELEEARRTDTGPGIPSIQRAPRDGALPLSFPQQRLWFLDQLDPGSASYNIPLALRLEGVLDLAALREALETLVRRHEVLRTTFRTVQGQPRQEISPEPRIPLELHELSSLPEADRAPEVLRLVTEEAGRPFDLASGPLLRASLLRLGDQDHVLIFSMHHIVTDAWSMGVVAREVAALYEAALRHAPSPLPELPLQYADYAVWQRQWLQGDVLSAQLDGWRQRLAGAPAVLELPTDRPRPPVQTFRGARHSFRLPADVAERLGALGQQEKATPFMTLLAAFQVLLGRYSGQDDICVGSPIAGRRMARLEGLIGFFVNTLVLRSRLAPGATFRELVRQVRETTLDAYAHQDLPFEQLVEELRPERDLSTPPLFQVMFVVQNAPVSALRVPGLKLQPLDVETSTSRFDLTLQFAESPEGWAGSLEYNTDLFDAGTVARLATHFQVLLAAALTAPDTRLESLPLLTGAERQQVLVDWNTLRLDPPAHGTLHGLFEAQVARAPDARALSFEDQHLTYRELNARANQLAAWLRSQGVGAESRVGLYLDRSLELVIGLLAILKAGAAYVPMDPAYPRERLAFMVEDSGVPLLLTQQSLAAQLPSHQGRILCLDSEWPTVAGFPTHDVDAKVDEDHLAYVIYTSGSTGRPKGSLLCHGQVLRLFSSTQREYGFNARDVWTLFHSCAFDFSVWELWGALLYGGRLVVVPYWVSRSPGDFHALLRREAVTVLNQTPSAFRQLIQHEQSLENPPPLALRYVIFGGEALDFRGLQPWFALHGDSQPQLINMYGITETTVHVTYRPLSQRDASGTSSVVGAPIADLQAFILGPSLEPVPVGVPGELYIGGRGLARGYLNRPDLTAERFIPHPFSTAPGARLYKTGDRARFRADGQIDYLGRTDFQVKLRGFRIELGEIEAVLEQQPGLRQALVLAREDRTGDKRLVAYVVPAAGHAVDTATLRQELKARLPEYMVPSAFVTLEALPLTSNGKVDRRALPAPDASASATAASGYVAPRTPSEQRLAELWRDVLGVERVGATDSFFELGGHSLLAVQVMSRIRATFGVDLPLRTLFEHRTVEAVAGALEQLGGGAPGEEAPARSAPRRPTQVGRATGPASMAQRRWLGYAGSNPNRPKSAGNVPRCVHIKGRLDAEALERALNTLVERHEILRTHYARSDDGFAFQVPPQEPVRLERLDFTGLPREQCEEAVRQRVYQDAQTPFDLMAPPMFRAWLYQLGPEEQMLLVLTHHIAWDGWSEAIVLQEVTQAYVAYVRGEDPRLPELRIQYSDFAWWQHEQMQGEHLESLESYWRRHLADGVTMVDYPLDRPRPATRSYDSLSTTASFPAELSAAIKALCHREGVTLYMMAMAAYQALLALRSGARDVTVFSNIGSRDHLEVENLVGCFTNVMLIRTNLDGDPTFQELLTRVRDAVLGALAHSALPYQRVLDMIGMNPDSKSARTFPGLNMQNFQKAGGTRPPVEGLRFDRVNIPQGGSLMVNTFFFVSESDDQRISLMVQANGDVYEARTVERMVEDFQGLLAAGCANPDRRLSALLP